MDWIGAGFLKISKHVLEALSYPFFEGLLIEVNDEALETGEDIGFCLKCYRQNIPIFANFDIVLNHHKENFGLRN